MDCSERKVSITELGPIIEEQIANGNEVNLRVSGNSMYPFLVDNETSVLLAPIDKPLKRKDIVFYKSNNSQYLLHRIIDIIDSQIIIRGDALKQKEILTESNMIAKVISFERKGKTIDVGKKGYLFLVGCWFICFPIRGILIKTIKKFFY
ncbi:MAG: S24/S26 family peptidase [Bacilli bacterium]|jgi:hypothetical protein|nr:S24/S26 family peptidase [Bacilli bacterium]